MITTARVQSHVLIVISRDTNACGAVHHAPAQRCTCTSKLVTVPATFPFRAAATPARRGASGLMLFMIASSVQLLPILLFPGNTFITHH